MKGKIRVGTRGSKLAVRQTEIAINALKSVCPDTEFEIKVIKTTGDTFWDRPLYEMRGKGFFIKEIEEALLSGEIDLAVHSMKDVPTEITKGLKIAAILKREDPRDAFVSFDFKCLEELPENSVVGTSSFRRLFQIEMLNKNIRVVPIRGNVETRIRKMKTENLSGLILAYCGLKRLGLEKYAKSIIPREVIVPPAGQGAIGIEIREESELFGILRAVNDEVTSKEVELERRIQMLIGGGCHVPFGVNVESCGEFFVLYAFYVAQGEKYPVIIREKAKWSDSLEFALYVADRLKAPHKGG